LGLGNHIDHILVRRAAEALRLELPLTYYADFPYVIRGLTHVDVEKHKVYPISEENVSAWCNAMARYASQASTFWPNETQMQQEILQYWQNGGGSRLWFHDR
jgi:hypothetical protein